eukprot:scaffold757_cov246-Pinguiococcus_pyrenoidosus.AAC.27
MSSKVGVPPEEPTWVSSPPVSRCEATLSSRVMSHSELSDPASATRPTGEGRRSAPTRKRRAGQLSAAACRARAASILAPIARASAKD